MNIVNIEDFFYLIKEKVTTINALNIALFLTVYVCKLSPRSIVQTSSAKLSLN